MSGDIQYNGSGEAALKGDAPGSILTQALDRWPLRGSVTLLATVVVGLFAAILSVLIALLAWQSYVDTESKARSYAASSAHVVSAHIQWLVTASRQALEQVELTIGREADRLSEREKQAVTAIVDGLPGDLRLWIMDRSGNLTYHTGSDDPELDSAAKDRIFFEALQSGEEWHISSLVTLGPRKEQVFVVAHRLAGPGGAFAGAAAIVVPAALMSEFWASLELGPDSTVGLFRTDGWLVARFPAPDGPLDLSSYVLFTDLLPRADAGSYDATSPADGVTRIVGYRRVEGAPLVALASLSADLALQPFWLSIYRVAAVMIPAFVALGLLLAWLVKVLRRDQQRKLQLAEALERNQLLLREVHHRVKNNLQAVQALVQLQPIPAEAKQDMGNRLAAMMAVHEQAYRTDQFAQVDLAAYLETLAENLRKSYGKDVSVDCRLTRLHIDRDQALPIGLIANEVISNALKHAFPDGRAGRISVQLRSVGVGRAELSIEDDGVGYDASASTGGMGSRLIRGLLAQVGNDFTQHSRPGGTRFSLRFRTAEAEEAAASAA